MHPFFVLSASTVEFPVLCRGNMVRLSTAVRAALLLCPRGPRSGPSYSVSVHLHLLTPSAPLAGTSRFRRIAVYTGCLRCAGAPRRPASGSVLSLHVPSRHAILYDHGEPIGCLRPVPSPTALAFTRLEQLGTPKYPIIRFRWDGDFVVSWFAICHLHSLRPDELLAPLADLTGYFSQPSGLLLPGFRRGSRPSRRRI